MGGTRIGPVGWDTTGCEMVVGVDGVVAPTRLAIGTFKLVGTGWVGISGGIPPGGTPSN